MSAENPNLEPQTPLEPDEESFDTPDGSRLQAELDNLRAEKASLFERLARAQADFQNTRKRLENETEQRMQYANGELLRTLLPIIDNFERALAVDPAASSAQAVLDGLRLVHDQLMETLKKYHLQQVAPEPGTTFDPNLHEALLQRPDPRHGEEPVVLETLQKGYTLHDRRLRPAQVVVSRAP
jgi:molecular chaperone GrpE